MECRSQEHKTSTTATPDAFSQLCEILPSHNSRKNTHKTNKTNFLMKTQVRWLSTFNTTQSFNGTVPFRALLLNMHEDKDRNLSLAMPKVHYTSFPVVGRRCLLVTDLLRGNWSNGLWALRCRRSGRGLPDVSQSNNFSRGLWIFMQCRVCVCVAPTLSQVCKSINRPKQHGK